MTKEESIKQSQAKYKLIKEQNKRETEKRKEGVAYIHENKIDCFVMGVNYYDICVAHKWDGDDLCFSICFKSPKDQFSSRIAKGLLGIAMKYENRDRFVRIPLKDEKKYLKKQKEVRQFICGSIICNAMVNKVMPECIRRDVLYSESVVPGCIKKI